MEDMKESQKKAFDFAADSTKQLITLSTAIVTLTVTFAKDIIGGVDGSSKTLLLWTWYVFIASIFFGVWTLYALTGTLQPMSKEKKKEKKAGEEQALVIDETDSISINKWNVRLPSILQVILFITAIVMTVSFGYKTLSSNETNDNHENCYQIIRETKLGTDSTKYIDTLFVPRK